MSQFWVLFEKSVIVTSSIALVLVCTACYLWATGQALPEGFITCLMLVLGFFFGAKTEKSIQAQKR